MQSTEEQLKVLLETFGNEVERDKGSIPVSSTSCIDNNVPSAPGVYWIETTMPVEEMREAVSEVIGKNKRLRKNPPNGTQLLRQQNQELYVVYSGTEEDMRKRLKQHLFNQGHVDTVKLGCVIDEPPFSKYQWHIGFKQIDSYELRYAVEAWWRLNVGWPIFCLR